MLSELISENHTMHLEELSLIDSHFGTDIFIAKTDKGKYIVKKIPPNTENLENEGLIADYLHNNGISVQDF